MAGAVAGAGARAGARAGAGAGPFVLRRAFLGICTRKNGHGAGPNLGPGPKFGPRQISGFLLVNLEKLGLT